jgi:hypothetical protein
MSKESCSSNEANVHKYFWCLDVLVGRERPWESAEIVATMRSRKMVVGPVASTCRVVIFASDGHAKTATESAHARGLIDPRRTGSALIS